MNRSIKEIISDAGLRVTPQRLAVLKVLKSRSDHPAAQQIIEQIQKEQPNIAAGTIYNVLETFVEKKIINKISSSGLTARYDANTDVHHHLHCVKSNTVKDYTDDELNRIIEEYFHKKNIPDFKLENIEIHINGEFIT